MQTYNFYTDTDFNKMFKLQNISYNESALQIFYIFIGR